MADPRRPAVRPEAEAAKPPVREADQWKGSGGTGRFPQQPNVEQHRPSELEREERRLERLRLIAAPWPTPNPEFDPEPQEAA